MIMEAVAVKVFHEDQAQQAKAEAKAKRDEWKQAKSPALQNLVT